MDARQPAASVALLALAAALLAGCSKPGPAGDSGDGEPELASLADLGGCDFTYPDGGPVDCEADTALMADAAPPDQWVCIEQLGGFGADDKWGVAFLTDLSHHYGLRFQFTPTMGSGHYVGTAALTALDGSQEQRILFRSGTQGFLAFPDPLPEDTGNWTFGEIWEYSATGQPSFVFSNGNLQVHVTDYEGSPWVVWAFPLENRTAYFSSMQISSINGLTSWLPPDVYETHGADWSLRMDLDAPVPSIFSQWIWPDTAVASANPLNSGGCDETLTGGPA